MKDDRKIHQTSPKHTITATPYHYDCLEATSNSKRSKFLVAEFLNNNLTINEKFKIISGFVSRNSQIKVKSYLYAYYCGENDSSIYTPPFWKLGCTSHIKSIKNNTRKRFMDTL